jgi:hypothetical protein
MVTQSQIQSIVDGECSHEARAMLLQEIEAKPTEWRTLALALLEEQVWAKQISSLVDFNSTAPNANLLTAGSAQTMDSFVRPQPLVHVASIGQRNGSREESSMRSGPWLSVLAASFLVGIGIYGGSFLAGLNSMKSNDATGTFAKTEDSMKRIDDELPLDGRLDSEMRMLVSGPNRKREEIPIYDLNAIDHDVFVAREMYEVAKINQRLRKEGFELDVRPEYYTGKLNDGRQLIVPVKHVGLKPYGL